MINTLSDSNSYDNKVKFDLFISCDDQVELKIGKKTYKVEFSNINYNNREDLHAKLTSFFKDFFNKVDWNKGDLSEISLWKNSDKIEAKVVQKYEGSQNKRYKKIKMSEIKNIFSSNYNENVSENIQKPLLEVSKIKEKTLLESIGLLFMSILELLFGKTTRVEKLANEFKDVVKLLPNKIQHMILEQLNEVSEDEKTLLSYLRNNIEFPEGKEEEMILEILLGAYVILDDEGRTFEDWSKLQSCQERISSHVSDDKQFSVRGPIVKEWLFSRKQLTDETGKQRGVTWFQLERYPTKLGFYLAHFWTYILYKWTGENQGPYGSSKYQEASPLFLKLKPPQAT